MVERVYPAAAPVAVGRGLVASSFQYYLTGDESLRVIIKSIDLAGPVDLVWRTWSESERRIVTTRETLRVTDAPPSTTTGVYALDAGALLNVRVAVDATPKKFPLLWARVQLVRGFGGALDVIGTLLQGYLGENRDLGWPGSPLESGDNVSGFPFTASGATGGLSSTITVPVGERWRIVSGRFTYVAGAPVGDRFPLIALVDGIGFLTYVGMSPVAVIAGNTLTYSFGAAHAASAAGAGGQFHLSFPGDVDIGQASKLQALVSGGIAGDAFTSFLVGYRTRVDV